MAGPLSRRSELQTFRSLRTLQVLNVLAVGCSLAGATGAVLGCMGGGFASDAWFASGSALSTLVFGLGWAALLRHRRTIGGSWLRWGWLASIPLAIGNAVTACTIFLVSTGGEVRDSVGAGIFFGATVGAIIWIPGLIATLIAFGVPIAWAQKRAAKGLAGEERGELVIGIVSAVIAALSILVLSRGATMGAGGQLQPPPPGHTTAIAVLAILGLLSGAMASIFAARRENVRRKFVRDVEAGAVNGYRVDATAEGKVLIRVTSMGAGYRVANFEEHLAVLDENGEARRGQVG